MDEVDAIAKKAKCSWRGERRANETTRPGREASVGAFAASVGAFEASVGAFEASVGVYS